MKGTLFSTDYIIDDNNNMRLLEINTDTALTPAGLTHIDFSNFIQTLSDSNITSVTVISKSFQSDFVALLSQSLQESAQFITSFDNILEEDTTIYPTSISDVSDKFILRLAYDESAIFDSEYAKNKLGIIDLFSNNNDTNSIAECYISSSAFSIDTLPTTFNSSNIPDILVKDLGNVNNGLSFYKLGKSTETAENRYSEFKSQFSETDLLIKFYENSADTKVKSIRSIDIIYGSNLDIISLGSFISEGLFDKPTSIDYDDNQIANKTNVKHYYELTTNYPRFSNINNWGGIFEEEQVLKTDGTAVLIGEATPGTELKSYFIEGAPDTDVVSEFMAWSYEGSDLPSGSYETSSLVVNNIEQSLSNNIIFHITMEDGSDFRASGGAHLLVYDIDRNVLRYEAVHQIDETKHKLINLGGSVINIQSVIGEVLDGDYSTYIIDMETSDTFFLYNGELSVKIVTHNCFPAGTKITLADGSEKNIEELTTDDKLLTYNEKTGVLSEGSIGNILKKKEFLLIQLEAEDGTIVKSTPLHKFYIKGKGWVAAQDIVKGDVVIKKDKSESTIVDRNDLSGEVDVYHIIDVKDNHTYFAEGILVHNFKYGTCFPAGTKVITEDVIEDGLTYNRKNIEDIQIGDIVLSFNEKTKETEYKKVIGTNQPIHNDLVKYTFSTGTTLTCTFDHPIYINTNGNAYKLASYKPELTNSRYDIGQETKQIHVDDVVIFSDGGYHTITEITELDPVDTQTYIITVEDNHNFYANNILVHNK